MLRIVYLLATKQSKEIKKLYVFENSVLRNALGPKLEVVTVVLRRL